MHFAIPRFLWQNAMSCGFPGIYSWLYHIGFGTMNDVSNVFLYWLDGNLAAGWDTSEFIVTWMKNTRIANCNCKFARSFSSQTNECRLRYRLWLIVLTFVPFISDTRTLGRIYAKREEKKSTVNRRNGFFMIHLHMLQNWYGALWTNPPVLMNVPSIYRHDIWLNSALNLLPA